MEEAESIFLPASLHSITCPALNVSVLMCRRRCSFCRTMAMTCRLFCIHMAPFDIVREIHVCCNELSSVLYSVICIVTLYDRLGGVGVTTNVSNGN